MYKEITKSNIYKLIFANIDLNSLKKSYIDEMTRLDTRINNIKDNPKKKNQILEFESQKESLNKNINQIDKEIENYGEKPLISAGLYLSYGDQVVYLLGASYKEFMNYGAQYLMQYKMIEYAKENNYKKLNFYGIDGDFSKESKHYGLFDFKRGFNADVVELIGEFDLVSNKFYYYLYIFMFNVYKLLKKIKRFIRR
jgi:peptidoglycan pentaglycine glycine transferase (the second and third glycine)